MSVSKNKGQLYNCVVCQKGFAHMSSISRHRGTTHGKEKLVCTVGGRLYTSNNNLNSDMKTYHLQTIRPDVMQ